MHSDFNTLNESHLFVIPAEGTDGIDDLVDFLQGLSIHKPLEFFEVSFDSCVIDAARFV